ncbi:methyl-accepting chemotaxis protein [Desulfoplanes formicivorans]|uniref:Methyl-accepting chemotaxis protein n=1 Tax=Desulfoplanes formicivorans TaxID=1592317 RepID=A0A194AM27_9BACT|nr:Cache 3/Cache 2 fusion domain-containing protein [Desulfoplanes formicivorans]GAU09704.1 methyl-accepting chemotaxis protein [Desulfoplanes formicivorans]
MRLNFYQKIITGIVSAMIVLVIGICTLNYLQSKETLYTLGKGSLNTVSRTLSNFLAMQNQALQKHFNGPLATMLSDIESEGGIFVNKEQLMEVTVRNQSTLESETMSIPTLYVGLSKGYESTQLVDKIDAVSSTAASVFQVVPGKLIRVSTTIKNDQGKRIVGTYIPSTSPVYQTVMQGNDYRGMTDISGEKYLALYHPVLDQDGKVVAVLFVGTKVLTPEFERFFASINVAGKGHAFLMDEQGQLLLHSDREKVRRSLPAAIWDDIRGHEERDLQYKVDGVLWSAHARQFEPWGWYVGVALDEGSMLAGMDAKALVTGIIVVIASTILFTIIIMVMLRFLMRPLLSLAETAKKIAAGDLDARTEYDRKDAIGDTTQAVNVMAVEIKKKLGFAAGVLEGITLPAAVIDHRNQFTFINQAMIDILGTDLTREDCLGKSSGEVVNHGRGGETLAERSLKSREQINEEIVYTTPHGVQKNVSISATPVFDLDGNLLGVLSLWVDLTEIRAQQKQIEEQNRNIAEVARKTEGVAEQVSTAAEELAAQVEESSRGADQQLSQAEETQVAIEQLSTTAIDVARNASIAANLAEETKANAQEGAVVVTEMVELIETVARVSGEMQQDMEELGKQAQGIGDILGVITDIADQTNLLALNAAIEAARAGDAGRGFAVVADEVRKLAEKTMVATKEVSSTIGSIQKSAQASIEATRRSGKLIEQTTGLADRSGKSLESMVDKIQENADQVMRIAAAAEEQSAANEEIREAMHSIRRISEETANAMTESARAITELAQLSLELKAGMQGMVAGERSRSDEELAVTEE